MAYPKLTPIVASGSTTPRYLADRFAECFNVLDYGAKADGTTDDTIAIKAAISASSMAGGGRVYLPAGTYAVSAMIQIPSNISFCGAGMDRTTLVMSESSPRWTTVLWAGTPSSKSVNIEISDLTIDGKCIERLSNSGGTAGTDWPSGIPDTMRGSNVTVCYCENVIVQRVHSKDASLHCFDVTGASYYGIGTISSDGNHITVNQYPSRFVTIDSCIAEGGGDDNITTHQVSDIKITNCHSYNSKGTEVPDNSNAYEVDDGSRNVLISNCSGSGCCYGIQVKAHVYQAAPWNVFIQNCEIFNCPNGFTARHSDIRNVGTAAEIFAAAEIDVTDANGDDVNIYGPSPTGRGCFVDGLSIVAPKDYTSYGGTTVAAHNAININQYSDVRMSNVLISEGYYWRDGDYDLADGLDSTIVSISYKAENIEIDGLKIIGFKNLRDGLEQSVYEDPYENSAIYLGQNTKDISLKNITIKESRPYGVITNAVNGLVLDNINVIAEQSSDNKTGIYIGTPEATDSIGAYRVEGYVNELYSSNQRAELNIGSPRLAIGDKNSPANINSKTVELYTYYNNILYDCMIRNVEGAMLFSHHKGDVRTVVQQLTENGIYMAGSFTPSETYPSGTNSAQAVLKVGYSTTTNRSINAGGTINASGADYAEYMVKSDGCGMIQKGQVVGVDADGKLTDKFSRAHSFVVKSTKPSYVGGDTWSDALGERPEPPSTEGDIQPTAEDFEAYNNALAAYEERLESVRQTVDRIAFAGVAPCIVSGGFRVGDYVKAERADSDSIVAVAVSSPSFEDMAHVVGKIWKIVDGVAHIVVKPV